MERWRGRISFVHPFWLRKDAVGEEDREEEDGGIHRIQIKTTKIMIIIMIMRFDSENVERNKNLQRMHNKK